MGKNVWLMCGIPGSGKSTYILNHYNPKYDKWISRDDIRFDLLAQTPSQNYFSCEEEVWQIFVKSIREAIANNKIKNVYIDATHINQKSRQKILNQLDLSNVILKAIIFDVPIEICLKRNSQRVGLAYVPEGVIKDMYTRFNSPTLSEIEKYGYKEIKIIKE